MMATNRSLMTPLLYAITDDYLMPGTALFTKSEAALKGGCRWLQYRNKSQNSAERFQQAKQLKQLCHQYDAKFIVNDDVELASKIGADGVHLGQEDDSVTFAREILGPNAIVGVTCHNQLILAKKAIEDGASYVAFGRFFPSQTKPDAQAAPLNLLSEAQHLSVPIAAIGGITLANASSIVKAGATAIAVCHSLFSCNDVMQRAQDFCAAINA